MAVPFLTIRGPGSVFDNAVVVFALLLDAGTSATREEVGVAVVSPVEGPAIRPLGGWLWRQAATPGAFASAVPSHLEEAELDEGVTTLRACSRTRFSSRASAKAERVTDWVVEVMSLAL